MGEPQYRLEGIVHTKSEVMEDFEGGFYGSNEFREQHAKKFEGKLMKGETVYYEVVGFTDNGTPIMSECSNKKLNDKEFAKQYMNNAATPEEDIHWDFIRLAMASVSDTCIIPLQDYLGLGSEARINIPSTVGSNWKWRMKKGALSSEIIEKMAGMAKMYGRYNPANKPSTEKTK